MSCAVRQGMRAMGHASVTRKRCRKCGGEGGICSQSGRPWSRCDCGWCERGPSTYKACPKCKGRAQVRLPRESTADT